MSYRQSLMTPPLNALDLARANLIPLLDVLGAARHTEQNTTDQPAPISTIFNSSGFGNYGAPVGQPPPFNRVECDIVPYSTTYPVTEARLRIRSGGPSGSIIADTTVGVNITPTIVGPTPFGTSQLTPYRLIFDFGQEITPVGNLWLEVMANGLFFIRQGSYTYTVGAGYPECQCSGAAYALIYLDPGSNLLSQNVGTINIWFRFSNSDCNYVYESGNLGSIPFANSTFCGWGGPVGPVSSAFNRVEFDICPWDLTSVPQNGRLRVFTTNQSGNLLAEKQFSVSIPTYLLGSTTTSYRCVVDLDTDVSPNGQVIWIDFQMDGHCGVRELTSVLYPVSGGYTNGVYTTTVYSVGTNPLPPSIGTYAEASWSNIGVNFNQYYRLSHVAQDARRIRSRSEANSLLQNWLAQQFAPQIFLPATIYAVVGHETAIYFDNVIGPPLGCHAQYPSPLYTFIPSVTNNLGSTYAESWRYTPAVADVGTSITFTLNVYYLGILLASQSCSVGVKAATAGSPVTRQLVTIGDSQTAQGYWLSELWNLCNVNRNSPGWITSLTSSGTTATATTYAPHGLSNGNTVTVAGATSTNGYYNKTTTITATGNNTFTYTLTGSDSTPASGSYIHFATAADNLTITPVGVLTATNTPDAQGTNRAEQTDAVSGQTIAYFSTNSASSFAYSQAINSGGAQGSNTATLADVSEIVAGTYVQLTGGTSEVLVVQSVNVGTKTVTFTTNIANSGHTAANWFAFGKYQTNNSITLNANDWVLIMLGPNDVFGLGSDMACYSAFGTMLAQLKAMIADIQASVAGIRIGICIMAPPARTQDAWAANYGAANNAMRYRRNRELWLTFVFQTYQNSTANKIWLVETGLALDTLNNMQTNASTAINEYNTTIQAIQSNALHPAPAGFYQWAGAIYRFLRGQES